MRRYFLCSCFGLSARLVVFKRVFFRFGEVHINARIGVRVVEVISRFVVDKRVYAAFFTVHCPFVQTLEVFEITVFPNFYGFHHRSVVGVGGVRCERW